MRNHLFLSFKGGLVMPKKNDTKKLEEDNKTV